MGELHLEILVDRLLREFKVGANVGKPQVAYRETIKRPVEKVEGKYIRQSGGKGQYGHVIINLEIDRARRRLRVRRQDHRWTDSPGVHPRRSTRASSRPRQRHPRRIPRGRRAGDPGRRLLPRRRLVRDGLQDRRFDGVQEAAKKAAGQLLEPIMEVEVITPEDYMGDVVGDLSARRGKVGEMGQRGNAR